MILRNTFLASACLLLALSAIPAVSQVSVTSRPALGGNDFLDWGFLGGAFAVWSSPINATSNGGLSITVSKTSGVFYGDTQWPGGPWEGNFAPNDALLYNGPQFGQPGVPIDITFGTPVMGAGAQIGVDYYGPFTAELKAFDASNNLLFDQTFAGNMTSDGDNSAIFVGVLSNLANIKSIEFLTDINGTDPNDIALNQLSIKTGAANVTPETSSYLILIAGLVPLAPLLRRYRRRGQSLS